jgi:hypothetical protein
MSVWMVVTNSRGLAVIILSRAFPFLVNKPSLRRMILNAEQDRRSYQSS